MARTGWSNANFLRSAGAVVGAAPMSIGCWYQPATTPGGQVTIAGLFNSSQNVNGAQQISLNSDTSNSAVFKIGDGAGNTNATASGSFTNGAWAHVLGTYASATSYACYRDGANKGTGATSRIPSALDRTSVGVQDDSSPNQSINVASLVAELAIWNVALTDAEATILARRVSPLLVRPSNLVAYWPLIGGYAPEIDLKGGSSLTVQGVVSAAPHPALAYFPGGRFLSPKVSPIFSFMAPQSLALLGAGA